MIKEALSIPEKMRKILFDEGLVDSSSEFLIGQAEVQGFLIRVNENTWNWLS